MKPVNQKFSNILIVNLKIFNSQTRIWRGQILDVSFSFGTNIWIKVGEGRFESLKKLFGCAHKKFSFPFFQNQMVFQSR